jgi:hypothetical protein
MMQYSKTNDAKVKLWHHKWNYDAIEWSKSKTNDAKVKQSGTNDTIDWSKWNNDIIQVEQMKQWCNSEIFVRQR